MNYNIPLQISQNEKYLDIIKVRSSELISFFTPTYNRGRFLPRIEECLKKQTSQNFVWIVVNDGSSDNTDEVMTEIMRREELPIKFISKENGGKHSAFKAALDNCETDYFQCMDDDDLFFPDATAFFLKKWKEIKSSPQSDIIGAIRTLSRKPDGSYSANYIIDDSILGTEEDLTTLESYYLLKRRQENWTCYDTQKLKSVDLFSLDYWMSDKHKFFSEEIWQARFARKYLCRYIYQAFTEYRDDDENRLMSQVKSPQFFIDSFINAKLTLDEQYDYISRDFLFLIKRCLVFNWFRSHIGINLFEVIKRTSNLRLRLLYLLVYPTSFLEKWYVKHYC